MNAHRGSMKARGSLQALAAAALFGVSTPLCKPLVAGLHANLLAGLLYLGAAICLAPMVVHRLCRGRPTLPADRRNRMRLAGAIFFGGVLGPVLVLLGLELALAASVSMWLSLETVATAILALLLFREHIGRWAWVANLGVVVCGVLLGFHEGWAGWMGLLCIAGAAIAWGLDNNLTALIDGISPEDSTFWKGLIAGLSNMAIGLALAAPAVSIAWLWALLVGGLSYGASIALYIRAAQNLGATRSQMLFASAPLFGVLLSVVWLGEGFGILQGVAAAILLLSTAAMFLDRHEHPHFHEALRHEHEHRHDDGHHTHTHAGLPAATRHSHMHEHAALTHTHPHWPDLHHRHAHRR